MNKLLAVFSLVFLVACKKEATVIVSEQTLTNVSYGSDTAQRMDIYLPAGRSENETKVIVLVHGGAWVSGDKSEFNQYIPVIKQKLPGYAIFNINYRLATYTANYFPAQEDDMQLAVDFILSKSKEYKFKSSELVLLGASAGAHMVMLQAFKRTSPRVKAVVDFFGPTDMAALYNTLTPPNKVLMQIFLGGTPTSNPGMYQQSSPLNFVSAQSPPTIILHGGTDDVVPISQSYALQAKLQTHGVTHQVVVYPTEWHGWVGANMDDSFNRIAAFLLTNVP